jgi:hypothetical protein
MHSKPDNSVSLRSVANPCCAATLTAKSTEILAYLAVGSQPGRNVPVLQSQIPS